MQNISVHMESKITLIGLKVCGVEEGPIKLFVSPDDKVSTVLRALKLDNCRVTFKGKLLSSANTFKFYAIQDSDAITVVPPHQPSINMAMREFKVKAVSNPRWLNYISEPQDMLEQVMLASNPSTADEAARLSDLYNFKIERTPKCHTKLLHALNTIDTKLNEPEQLEHLTEIPIYTDNEPSKLPVPPLGK